MIVQWREQFAHGSAAIDTDHRVVIDMINDLDVAIAVASPPEVVARVLDAMAERIADHLRREDGAAAAGGGREILARVCQLRDDWRRGTRTRLDRGQLVALGRRWVSHIDAVGTGSCLSAPGSASH